DVWICCLDFINASSNGVRDHHIARSLCAHNAESDDRRAVESRKCARFGYRIGDQTEIVEPYLATRRQRNPRRSEFGNRFGSGQRSDGLIVSANFGPPAGYIHVAAAQLATNIERGQADALQSKRVEPHADLALDASDAVHAGDATYPLQRTYDHVCHELG